MSASKHCESTEAGPIVAYMKEKHLSNYNFHE